LLLQMWNLVNSHQPVTRNLKIQYFIYCRRWQTSIDG
jgi:hypothetical protein